VYKLVPFELGALNKRLATFSADVHARAMSVKMLAHCSVVAKQLAATLQRQQQTQYYSYYCTVSTNKKEVRTPNYR